MSACGRARPASERRERALIGMAGPGRYLPVCFAAVFVPEQTLLTMRASEPVSASVVRLAVR